MCGCCVLLSAALPSRLLPGLWCQVVLLRHRANTHSAGQLSIWLPLPYLCPLHHPCALPSTPAPPGRVSSAMAHLDLPAGLRGSAAIPVSSWPGNPRHRDCGWLVPGKWCCRAHCALWLVWADGCEQL